MLCLSALLVVSRCVRPSVCQSVTLYILYCIQTAKDIARLLYRLGSPITLVSSGHPALSNFKGTHSAGVLNTPWERLRFSTEIAIYLGNGTYKPTSCYGALIGSHGGESICVSSDNLE